MNVRDYIRVKLHTTPMSALNAISDPFFKNYSIVDENLVQTNHYLEEILHKTPIAIGVTILDFSKAIMFDAYYNHLSNSDAFSIDLGFSDTDSFFCKVSDEHAFWKHVASIMDYSNYPTDHPLFSEKNKAKLGFFKSELAGRYVCTEFVGLRAKCYALQLEESQTQAISQKLCCKGIGKTAIARHLHFEEYKACLYDKKTILKSFATIRSTNHSIRTVSIKKRALSFLDTKRYLFDCGIHSVPFGSYLIQKFNGQCPRCKNLYTV